MGRLKEYAERERQNALILGDATIYFDLCNQLGMQMKNVENLRLYDAGRQPQFDFEGGLENTTIEEDIKPIVKKRNRRVKFETYLAFFDEAEKIEPNNVSDMRSKLLKYFPYRFGPYGKTPLMNMNDSQVMGAFRGNVNYTKRRITEKTI